MQVNLHDANRQYGPSHGTGLAGECRAHALAQLLQAGALFAGLKMKDGVA